MANKLQCVEQKKTGEKEFLEIHHRMPDGKLIAIAQVCIYCRNRFAPERGRKYCPKCNGLLINKTIVFQRH
ncbi:hypothetical protein KEJ15_01735 [Candidatus Bathyarchaeota archaeon]|nr:hypothetical protein [Candidatus Bathyarchaeota archaeon]